MFSQMIRVGVFTFGLTFMSLSYAENRPLLVDVPRNWETEYEDYTEFGFDGVQSFKLTRIDDARVYFYFALSSLSGDVNQAREFLRVHINISDEETSEFPELSCIEKIEGVEFSGDAAIYIIDKNLLHASFYVSDGSEIWNGQCDGPKEMWIEARSILVGLKRAAKKQNEKDISLEPPIR